MLVTKIDKKDIPKHLNRDPNPDSDEDDEPRPPSYKSSDEESEQEPHKMPAKKLNALLQKVRKGPPKTEMEIIV